MLIRSLSKLGQITIPLIGGIVGALPSAAQPVLEQATIYNLINTALINESEADLEDILFPEDIFQTEARSRADLLFNEGTIARATANTTFRFQPGLRRFQLTDGTELFIIRPDNGGTIETPNAQINVPGTALFVQYDPNANSTRVGVLTDHPREGVQVANAQGENAVELNGGEIATVTNDDVGSVQQFNLRRFYATSELTAGIGPGCQNQSVVAPAAAQATLSAVCPETLDALQEQQADFPATIPAAEAPNDNIRGISPPVVGADEEDFPIRTDRPIEQQELEPIQEPVQEPIEEPVQEPVEEPIEEPVQEPIEEPVEEPVQDSPDGYIPPDIEKPVEEPIEEPIKQQN